MLYRLARLSAVLAIFAFAMPIFGQVIPEVPGRDLMPLAELKAGMKGTARTVFSGTKPEEFGVEILGVVPGGIGPKQDLIVGKLSGANADRTLVFAGMSGSPVYVNGKLVGAISYSFPYAKEAICGITPIEEMISIFEKPDPASRLGIRPAAFSYLQLMSANWRALAPGPASSVRPAIVGGVTEPALSDVSGQTFVPIATPLAFGGISQATVDAFGPDLLHSGMIGVSTVGGTGTTEFKQPDARTLLGGDSVIVQLARGDLSIAAAGTVTWRDGNKIYAFGHPYFSLGSSDLPMNESHVVTVVPNINNSFKLAVADSAVGSMVQDRATGIFGELGRPPKMLPVAVHIKTSRGRDETVRFESALDDFLTPLIVNIGVLNSIQGNERTIGDTTIDVRGEVSIKGKPSVRVERRYSGAQAAAFAASSPAVPLAALLNGHFPGLELTGVDLNLSVNESSQTASLNRISVDRGQVKAGDTVNVTLELRNEDGALSYRTVAVKIPDSTPAGPLSLMVADGNTVQTASAVQQFAPKTADEMIAMLNSLRRSDQLYAVLSRNAAGTIVGASELSNLPPSMLATINSDRSAGGAKATTSTTVAEYPIASGGLVLSGSQTVTLDVER